MLVLLKSGNALSFTATEILVESLGLLRNDEPNPIPTMNGENLYENRYYVTENGVQKEQRALWLQRDRNIYVILMSALATDFEKEKPFFDVILNSLRIQG